MYAKRHRDAVSLDVNRGFLWVRDDKYTSGFPAKSALWLPLGPAPCLRPSPALCLPLRLRAEAECATVGIHSEMVLQQVLSDAGEVQPTCL